jgi:predicted phosphodiesterase
VAVCSQVDTRLDQWATVFADRSDEVATVVCGHTHMPFVRLVTAGW